jgi:hypothetical protein
MKRRWITRGILIGLLLLCVGAWTWSASNFGLVAYQFNSGFIGCATKWGAVRIVLNTKESVSDEGGWHANHSITRDSTPDHDYPTHITHWFPVRPSDRDPGVLWILGFSCADNPTFHALQIPYWFFVVLLSSILFFVWRKTRPKVKGLAFPVGDAESPAPEHVE